MRQGQRVHPSAVTAVAGVNDEIQAAPVDLTALQLKVEDHEAGIREEQGPNVGEGRHEKGRQHTEERRRKTTPIASDEGQMLDVGVMKEEQSVVEGPGGEQGMKRKRAGTRKSKVKTGDAVVKQAGGKKKAVAWDAMTVFERGFGGFDGARVAVGCSGCQYQHWHSTATGRPNFYAFGGSAHDFDFYARVFNALEINSSFYRIPEEGVVDRWRQRTPRPDFVYTAKAHRYFTHTKRAIVDEWFIKKWRLFYGRWTRLGGHLRCVLFQFPHAFRRTDQTLARLDDLGRFLKHEHPTGRFAVELRDVSWFHVDVYAVLRRWDLCLAAIHTAMPSDGSGPKSWGGLTSGFYPPLDEYVAHCRCTWASGYLRLHGTIEPARGSYGHAALHACLTQLLGPSTNTNTFTTTSTNTNSPPPSSFPSPSSPTPSAPSPLKTEPEDPHTPTVGETQPSPGPLLVFFNNDATPDNQGEEHYPSAVADALRVARIACQLCPQDSHT